MAELNQRQPAKASSWVVFLASSAACQSPYVQQELEMAIGANKKLVPIIWEISPSALAARRSDI